MKNRNEFERQTQIRLPYCNWDKFRALQNTPIVEDEALQYDNSVAFRVRSVMGPLTEIVRKDKKDTWSDPVNGIDLQETEFITLQEARQLAAIRFADKLREAKAKGIFIGELVEACGMDKTSAARYVSGTTKVQVTYVPVGDGTERMKLETNGFKRGFSAPLEAVPVIADRITECTSHQLLFGEEKDIVLPGKYSYIAEQLTKTLKSSHQHESTEADIDMMLQVGNRLWQVEQKEYKERNPEDNTNLAHDGQLKAGWKLLRERILDLCYENPYSINPRYTFLHLNAGPIQMKRGIDKICFVNPEKEKNGQYDEISDLSLESYMLFALESGQAVDFFLANDIFGYMGSDEKNICRTRKHTPNVYYIDSENRKMLITDEKIKAILSYCMGLNENNRNSYIPAVIGRLLKYT